MKQKQVREVAYLGKKVYFGNKPYTLVENEVKVCVKDVIYTIVIALLGLLHCVPKDLYLKEISNERRKEE